MAGPPDDPTDPATAPGAAPPSRRQNLIRGLRMLGIGIAVLAVFLLVRTLIRQWPSISLSLAHANVVLLIVAFLLAAVGMEFLALLWRQCLSVFGDSHPVPRVSAWYFAGELGKYVPGGIWPVVGRGELARRGGVPRSVAYTSTLLSLGVMCVGGAVTCGVLAPVVASEGGRVGPVWLLLAVAPLGIAVVHPAIFRRLLGLAYRVTRGRIDLPAPPWRQMIVLILVSVPAWVSIGLASVVTSSALHLDQQPARVLFAAVAAWVVGFLAILVPAGAGVRELVFVALCGLASGPAVAVAALTRVMLILVDGLGGVGGLIVLRRDNVPATESPRKRDGVAP